MSGQSAGRQFPRAAEAARASFGESSGALPHERLSRARRARSEELESIARRIGVRVQLLRAIEDGRYADLPGGVYARGAIRSYAVGLDLPPDEILADCEPLLPLLEDPIVALCRLRGIRSSGRAGLAPRAPAPPMVDCPTWQLAAVATLDALVVVALLLGVVACTVTVSGLPLAALGRAAPPAFAATAAILWVSYIVLFGGIARATVGERVVGLRPRAPEEGRADLRLVATRALRCACRDASFIELLGGWLGGLTTGDRSLPHRETARPLNP